MCALRASQPRGRGAQFQLAQYSNTPSLRVAGFEDDDDEDENEAPHEKVASGGALNRLGMAIDYYFALSTAHHESPDAVAAASPSNV
jgi:hypothetical protein